MPNIKTRIEEYDQLAEQYDAVVSAENYDVGLGENIRDQQDVIAEEIFQLVRDNMDAFETMRLAMKSSLETSLSIYRRDANGEIDKESEPELPIADVISMLNRITLSVSEAAEIMEELFGDEETECATDTQS